MKSLIFMLATMLSLTACSFEEQKLETVAEKEITQENEIVKEQKYEESAEEESIEKSIEEYTEVEQSEAETLHFIDAWDEWHDTVINPQVPKHDYNWDGLKNTGSEISYIGDSNYSIRKGIDVSYHQGPIDWEKVKNDGIDFAFIRIGYRGYGKEGILKSDTEFKNNIVNADKAGIDIGVYIFSQAVNEEEALEEAQLVIDSLQEADIELQLPVVYDPELIRDDVARTDNISGEQFTRNTIVFCEKIKEAGYDPMIYSNMIWEAFYFDMTQLTEYQIWYADYETIPQTPYWFSFWQYSCDGRVDGISGRVDMNLQFIKK